MRKRNNSSEKIWRRKTIETLEKRDFGNLAKAPTSMTKRCLELCKVPLSDFTVEDLRLMIGQGFALRYLIPLAIEHLKEDIFTEGSLFPGDLLKNVLAVDREFWNANTELWSEVSGLIRGRHAALATSKIRTETFESAMG